MGWPTSGNSLNNSSASRRVLQVHSNQQPNRKRSRHAEWVMTGTDVGRVVAEEQKRDHPPFRPQLS
jgi:hypothetical protein